MIETFQKQMADAGINPGDIITDAVIHRFPTWGDQTGEKSGAYWHNGNVGWFQDWRTMQKPAVVKGKLSEADQAALKGSFSGANNQVTRKALESGIRRIWAAGTEPNGHPYLKRKGITAPPEVKLHDGCLIVPVFGVNGELNGLQKIDADGRKRFLAGTRKKGSMFGIKGNRTFIICEGFATGVSLFEATGASVCVAFDAGNLKPVALEVAKKVEPVKIIIAGDNDTENMRGNIGANIAKKAAAAIGCRYVLPEFKKSDGKETTDFNDLFMLEGSEVVKQQIEASFREKKKRIYHLTDMGNAERLVDLHGQDFRYCYKFKRWFVWDGKRWNGDDMGLLRRMCKDTIKSIYEEASSLNDDKARKALIQYALKCETVKKARDMIEFSQSENGIPIQPEDLDKNIYLLNCLNGTVDLRTGELRPHRRENLITKLVPANYNEAKCPVWLEHLDKIMGGNADLIEFLQKAFGYSLTGDTSERKIFIQWGSGANGKSVTNDAIAMVMGDYAMRTPTETLLAKRNDGIPSDIARLKGARFVYASEAEQGKRLAESLIKDISGGDKISARFLHQEWFEFYPEFKLWLGTNHKPVIRGTDQAIWDRIRLIPFTVKIPEDERIPKTELFEMLQNEIDGIFSWLVEGCLKWQEDGLGMPEEVKAATKEYRNEMDVLSDFIEDRCILCENCTVSAKELYNEYVKWTKENDENAITKKMFGINLNERDIDSYKGSRNVTMRAGIGIQKN